VLGSTAAGGRAGGCHHRDRALCLDALMDQDSNLTIAMCEATKGHPPEEIFSATASFLAGLITTAPKELHQDLVKRFTIMLVQLIVHIDRLEEHEIEEMVRGFDIKRMN
jgi:hypothetical protein